MSASQEFARQPRRMVAALPFQGERIQNERNTKAPRYRIGPSARASIGILWFHRTVEQAREVAARAGQ